MYLNNNQSSVSRLFIVNDERCAVLSGDIVNSIGISLVTGNALEINIDIIAVHCSGAAAVHTVYRVAGKYLSEYTVEASCCACCNSSQWKTIQGTILPVRTNTKTSIKPTAIANKT